MIAAPSQQLRTLAHGVIALALFAVLVWAGTWLLFTTFMVYDDEGYVLISLRNYGAHGHLYNEVYSQYGPGFFALYDALATVLRFEWTNTSARWLTLGLWIGTAGFVAAILWRYTRTLWAATLGFATTFVYLWIMIREPSHPGGLIGLLVAAGAYVGCRRDPARNAPTAAVLGAIGVLLLLTKINVGVFFLTSAGGWLLAHALIGRPRITAVALTAGWLAAMPVLLMRKLVDEAWVPVFMLISALAGLAAWRVVNRHAQPESRPRVFVAMVGTAAALAVVILGLTLARGTTPEWLLRGVILDPINQTRIYTFAFPWLPGSLVLAVATALFTVFRDRIPTATQAGFIHGMRLLAAAGAVASFLGLFERSAPAFGMSYGAAMGVWCAMALPGTDPQSQEARARRWLSWLLVGQFLHGFPVAGSQINWATFLVLPLIVLALRESWQAWRPSAAVERNMRLAIPALALLLATQISVKLALIAQEYRQNGAFLDQPGAEKIWVTDEIVFGQQSIAATVRNQADMLFSVPGCYSLNLWTGVPTPTMANATQWFGSLNEDRQLEIVAQLKNATNPMVVVQRSLLQVLVNGGFSTSGPLADYINQNFITEYAVDGYALWRRLDRTAVPLDIARPASAASGVDITLESLPRPVARIDWWILHPGGRLLVSSVGPSEASLVLGRLDGAKALAPSASGWGAQAPSGPVRLHLEMPAPTGPEYRLLLVLVDTEGRSLRSVRWLP